MTETDESDEYITASESESDESFTDAAFDDEFEVALMNPDSLMPLVRSYIESIKRKLSPSIAESNTRKRKFFLLQNISESMQNIQRIYNQGLETVITNIEYHFETKPFDSPDDQQSINVTTQTLVEEKIDIEADIEVAKRHILILKPENETIEALKEWAKHYFELYQRLRILDAKLAIFEADIRIQEISIVNAEIANVEPYRRNLTGRTQFISPEYYETPESTTNDEEWRVPLDVAKNAVISIFEYLTCLRSWVDIEFLEVDQAIKECPPYLDQDEWADSLHDGYVFFMTPDFSQIMPEMNAKLNKMERSGRLVDAWELVAKTILEGIELTMQLQILRQIIFTADIERKNHFIRLKMGYIPKILFPNIEAHETNEVSNIEISPHYFHYRDLGVPHAWMLIDEYGNIIPHEFVMDMQNLIQQDHLQQNIQ